MCSSRGISGRVRAVGSRASRAARTPQSPIAWMMVEMPWRWARAASSVSRCGGVRKTPRSVPSGSGLPSSGSIGSSSAAVRDASVPSAKSFSQPNRARPPGGPSGSPLRSSIATAVASCSERIEAWTRDDAHVQRWYETHGFVLIDGYLHVYLERDDLRQYDGELKLVKAFAHYTGDRPEEIRRRYARVHDDVLYEKRL